MASEYILHYLCARHSMCCVSPVLGQFIVTILLTTRGQSGD